MFMKRKEFGPTKAKKGRGWTHTVVQVSALPPGDARVMSLIWKAVCGISSRLPGRKGREGQRVAWLLFSDLPGSQKQQNSQAPKENLGEIPCLWEFSSLREMPDHPVRRSEACGKGALDWGLT